MVQQDPHQLTPQTASGTPRDFQFSPWRIWCAHSSGFWIRWRSRSSSASVGSSMGGMQSLAAGVLFPERVRRIVSISGCARSHPYSIAMRHTQRQGKSNLPTELFFRIALIVAPSAHDGSKLGSGLLLRRRTSSRRHEISA